MSLSFLRRGYSKLSSEPSPAEAGEGHQDGEYFVVRSRATGRQTLYGVASAYDNEYPAALAGLMRPEEHARIIERTNDVILG